MSSTTTAPSTPRLRPLGVHAIVAYGLVLAAPRELRLPTSLPLGLVAAGAAMTATFETRTAPGVNA